MPARDEHEPQERLDHVRVQNVVRPHQEPVRIERDELARRDVERGRQRTQVLAIPNRAVGPALDRDPQARSPTEPAPPDDQVGLDGVVDVERGELGQADPRAHPDQALDVVVEPLADRDLVPAIAAGPDPAVRDHVANAERQPDRDEVRDQVMDAEQIGEDEQHRDADGQRRDVEQVEHDVPEKDVAAVVPVREDPQLGEHEVVERRHLRREDRRHEVVDAQPVGQRVQRDLVDDDPDDADEGELRGAEQGPQETANSRAGACRCLLVGDLAGDLWAPRAGSAGPSYGGV